MSNNWREEKIQIDSTSVREIHERRREKRREGRSSALFVLHHHRSILISDILKHGGETSRYMVESRRLRCLPEKRICWHLRCIGGTDELAGEAMRQCWAEILNVQMQRSGVIGPGWLNSGMECLI
jgi:hypothetical protein